MCQKCNQREQELELIPELEYFLSDAPSSGYAPPSPASPPPPPSQKPMVDPKKVSCAGYDKSYPIFKVIGTTDPAGALETIVQRSVAMLTSSIDELTRVQGRIVDFHDPIGWPLMNDTFALSLAKRMQVNVTDPGTWDRKTGKVSLIIRWLTNMRKILAGGELWYICIAKDGLHGCRPTRWAFVFNSKNHQNQLDHKNFFQINLCARFWNPGICKKNGKKATPQEHFEFQAQALIHEASHIYYQTTDKRGLGPGVAECIRQFVAESNGSPTDECFLDRCGGPLIKP